MFATLETLGTVGFWQYFAVSDQPLSCQSPGIRGASTHGASAAGGPASLPLPMPLARSELDHMPLAWNWICNLFKWGPLSLPVSTNASR